ncbi:MAG: hypothetical protein WC254_03735 [Candidatus Woesearchaeota archaeon]|jgi:hypothetical protein
MKLRNKYLFIGSFILCLTLIVIFAYCYFKTDAESELLPSETDYFIQVSYIARDIPYYTHDASAIIIGTVQEVNSPYVKIEYVTIGVDEVLKGDSQMTNVTIYVDKHIVDGVSFVLGENVLLFLGTDTEGSFIDYAGPYGKYLINDEGTTVTSFPDFNMSLKDLKWQINDTLERECPTESNPLHATPLVYCS